MKCIIINIKQRENDPMASGIFIQNIEEILFSPMIWKSENLNIHFLKLKSIFIGIILEFKRVVSLARKWGIFFFKYLPSVDYIWVTLGKNCENAKQRIFIKFLDSS